ncbi:hypothetical protein Cgig2_001154 [Carnegiea gigantea]|uniref:Uncharacterized protein n=1 Tax=Carnegiea gigantea TaxID=171969 RepID=A0A9Q1K4B9_9CARY|nr:hypothetical protein Cgig2_001154 [Carnegiea gigantea]
MKPIPKLPVTRFTLPLLGLLHPPSLNPGGQRGSHTSNASLRTSQWPFAVSLGALWIEWTRPNARAVQARSRSSHAAMKEHMLCQDVGKIYAGASSNLIKISTITGWRGNPTISKTGSIEVPPFFLSTTLPGALGAPRDGELADIPLEEEFVDNPSEEELADVLSEDELVDVLAKEEVELLDGSPDTRGRLGLNHSLCLEISDFLWIRNLFLNTEDARIGGILVTRP